MDELRPSDYKEETTPTRILERAYQKAIASSGAAFVAAIDIQERIAFVSRGKGNKSCARVVLSYALAKVHKPEVDIRKPYTEIGDSDVFSGRSYDEQYIAGLIARYQLPCNATTGFLTPGWRTNAVVLTPDLEIIGRPRAIYRAMLQLLDDVYKGRITAEELLVETLRQLAIIRDENKNKIKSLLDNLKRDRSEKELAAEAIVKLIEHHLNMSGSSRLPVLIVAAAYKVAQNSLGERVLQLEAHNAADRQTGALGDL